MKTLFQNMRQAKNDVLHFIFSAAQPNQPTIQPVNFHRARVSARIMPARCAGMGFTLIEMLAVILIIAILATIGLGLYQQARNAAWKQKARDSARQIATAWNLRLIEDHAFPATTAFVADPVYNTDAPQSITFETGTNNMMVLNSTKIYLEQNADQRKYGMKDKWGQSFHVRLDMNFDGVVTSPLDNTPIHANVVVWSLGPYPGSTNSLVWACP